MMKYQLGREGIVRAASFIFPAFSTQANHLAAVFVGKFSGYAENFDGAACLGATFDTISDGAKDDAAGLVHTRIVGSRNATHLLTSANGGALAASAVIKRETTERSSGGLVLSLEGVDGTAAIAGLCQQDSSGNAVEWINHNESFEMEVSCETTTGMKTDATKGLIQIGVAGGLAGTFASDISAAPANDGLFIQIEKGSVHAVAIVNGTEYKSKRLPHGLIDGKEAKFVMTYLVKNQMASLIVKNVSKGQSAVSVNIPRSGIANMFQVFSRVGHTAAYAAATDTPISMEIFNIAVNKV